MLQTIAKSDKRFILHVSGSCQVVEEGQVSSATLHTIHRDHFRFALGEGTFSDPSLMGAALILDSKRYVSYMHDGKIVTESRETFTSPFLMGVESNQAIGELVKFERGSSISLHGLYEKLIKTYKEGFLAVGYGLAKEIRSSYFKKPPTDWENTAVRHSGYMTQLASHKDQGFSSVGVVVPGGGRSHFPKPMLDRIFSHTFPENEGGAFSSRTNVALFGSGSIVLPKDERSFLQSIKNSSITGIGHMLGESIIEEATFAIFPIADIRSEEKPQEEPKRCRETLRVPFTSAPKE